MSNHANKSTGAPTSSRSKIKGSGATYRASVQRQSRSRSSTKPATMKKREADVLGEGSNPTFQPQTPNIPSYGSGHYIPNRG